MQLIYNLIMNFSIQAVGDRAAYNKEYFYNYADKRYLVDLMLCMTVMTKYLYRRYV